MLTINKTQSGLLAAGDYSYQCKITEDADEENVITVETGSFKVLPNLAAISGDYDGRSDKEKYLQSVRDAIAQLLSNNAKRYKIKDREFDYQNIEELRAIEKQLEREVARERQRATGISRQLYTRF